MSFIHRDHFLYPFVERAFRDPNGTCCAILERGNIKKYSNREIYNLSNKYVKLIKSFNLFPGEVIPIILNTGIEMYASFMGISMAGCIPTILPPYNKKQDPVIYKKSMSDLLSRINSKFVISSRIIMESDVVNENLIFIEDHEPCFTQLENSHYPFYKEVAFLQHSSGTTGNKKGVMISHENILRHAYNYAECIELMERDVIASWLPIYHDMGLITSFLMPIIKGNMFVTMDPLEWSMRPDRFLQMVTNTKASFAWFPDFAFNHTVSMSRATDIDLSSIKKIVSCSEPCRYSSVIKFYDKFSKFGLSKDAIHASYAMAENVFCVTQTKKSVYSEAEETNSIAYVSSGIPMDGVGVLIKDDFGALITNSDVGEIWIFGSSLTNGYYLMPELTNEKFIDDIYKTGDMGFMKDGELYVIGRNDDILNINGKKIVAHEIESIISDIPGVIPGRCLAFSVYDIGKSVNGLGVIFEHELQDVSDVNNTKRSISTNISSSSSIDVSELYAVERGFIVKSTSGKISRKSNIVKLKSRLQAGI